MDPRQFSQNQQQNGLSPAPHTYLNNVYIPSQPQSQSSTPITPNFLLQQQQLLQQNPNLFSTNSSFSSSTSSSTSSPSLLISSSSPLSFSNNLNPNNNLNKPTTTMNLQPLNIQQPIYNTNIQQQQNQTQQMDMMNISNNNSNLMSTGVFSMMMEESEQPKPAPDLSPLRTIINGINTEDWRFDDFELLETLGTGTFGRVRLCKHKKTQNYFAMKILKKKHIIRLKQVEHILNEKKILAHCDHSFIVRLYKTFTDDTNLYMIMEYVVGGEMFYHLRKAGKFPNDVAKFYAAEIVLAIEYLHKYDVVYRDLKPENLLLDEKGHIKLTDFGFAKVVHGYTYTLCGTPEYLAPEIIQSKGHNKAVDWWALGILIYEMLVGYPPFFDESPYRIYEKILAGRIEFPRFVDPAAKDLIKKLLALDRSKRFGNLKSGSDDIKKHRWFAMVDWDMLYQKRIDAPIPVQVSGSGDSRYYEDYQNSIEEAVGPGLTQEQQEYFKEF